MTQRRNNAAALAESQNTNTNAQPAAKVETARQRAAREKREAQAAETAAKNEAAASAAQTAAETAEAEATFMDAAEVKDTAATLSQTAANVAELWSKGVDSPELQKAYTAAQKAEAAAARKYEAAIISALGDEAEREYTSLSFIVRTIIFERARSAAQTSPLYARVVALLMLGLTDIPHTERQETARAILAATDTKEGFKRGLSVYLAAMRHNWPFIDTDGQLLRAVSVGSFAASGVVRAAYRFEAVTMWTPKNALTAPLLNSNRGQRPRTIDTAKYYADSRARAAYNLHTDQIDRLCAAYAARLAELTAESKDSAKRAREAAAAQIGRESQSETAEA